MDTLLGSMVSLIDTRVSPSWRNTVAVVTTILTHLVGLVFIIGSIEVFSILISYVQARGVIDAVGIPVFHLIRIVDYLVVATFVMLGLSSVIKLLAHPAQDEKKMRAGVG